MAKPDESIFLVLADEDRFLFDMTPERVSGTPIPSAAAHYPYVEADRICQELRRRGYNFAVVCNALGQPVRVDELRSNESVGPA